MSKTKVVAIAAAALVAGLVLGTMTIAGAATTTTTPGAVAGACGLRFGAMMRQSGATLADVVAKLTGLKVEDVRASRQDGKSFKEIAESKGVSSDKVVGSALDARKTLLDAKVKDGSITQEQADAALKTMATRLNYRVNSTARGCNGAGAGNRGGAGAGGGCGMGGGGRGMMGGGACGGGGCGAAVTQ